MECVGCHNDRPVKARGLCKTCYTRWQKTGSVEYLRWGKKKAQCSIEGCETDAKAGGLCPKHYQRQKKHGHTDITRGFYPEEWGNIRLDPRFAQWEALRRADGPRSVVDEWRDDFPTFATAVGERPSKKHRLYVVDILRPLGPDNFTWSLPVLERGEGEDIGEFRKKYRRAYREMFPEVHNDAHYRRAYGKDFGVAEYATMLAAQDGLCAICRQPETAVKYGKIMALCVDHDHGPSNKVRGLLCQACNKGLGYYRDRPTLLARASAYLISHGTDPAA